MSSPASQLTEPTNLQVSTGPRTAEGKAIASKNAITHGLFTKGDFIRPGDENIYAQSKTDVHTHLAPAGPLEYNLTDEIHRAIWRLRRCGEVEATLAVTLAATPDAATQAPMPDPMQHESTAKLQLSVDRARSQAHRLLHKSTAELRKLQTDRNFRNETHDGGLCDDRAIQTATGKQVSARLRKRHLDEAEQLDEICAITTKQAEALMTKRTDPVLPQAAQIARNAPCPCKSGEKYKRCCGKNAPPMLYAA